jgi:hypothetical protein
MSPIEADLPAGATPAARLSARRQFSPVRVWALALMAGFIAGFASWLTGEAIHARYAPPMLVNISAPSGGFLPGPEIRRLTAAHSAAQTLEATLTFGSLGAVLGLALGLAGGSARGSAQAALRAAIVGTIVGGAAGAAMNQALMPIFLRLAKPNSGDLTLAILIQSGIWSVVGAVGGVAFGLGLGDRSRVVRAIIGGLLGAIAGAVVYEMVGAILFPLDKTSDPISATWGTRLFARLAVTTLASAGVAMGALDQGKGASPYFVREEHKKTN